MYRRDARAPARASLVLGVLAAGLVASALFFAAPASAAASNRACGLLTTKQVEGALGTSVGAPVASKGSDGPVCEWRTAGRSGSGTSLQLTVFPITRAGRAAFAALAEDDANRSVRKLGDDAVLECTVGTSAQNCKSYGKLWVLVGDEYLGLSLAGPSSVQAQVDALTKIGRTAAEEI